MLPQIKMVRSHSCVLLAGLWGLWAFQIQAAPLDVIIVGAGGENRLQNGTTALPNGTVVDFGIFYSGAFISTGTISAQLQGASSTDMQNFRSNNGWVSFGTVTLADGNGDFTMAWYPDFPSLGPGNGSGLELNPTTGSLAGKSLKDQTPFLWVQTPGLEFGLFYSNFAFPDPLLSGALLQVDVGNYGLTALFGSVGDNGIITQAAGTSSTPLISSPRSLSAMSTVYGEASGVVAISVSGSNLGGDITATAPTGFEVSNNGSSFGPSTSFSMAAGSAAGTLSVRLKANAAAGDYNDKAVVLTSPGAADVNVLTAGIGNTVLKRTLNISGLVASNKYYDGTDSATVTGTPSFVGLQNGESFSVTAPPTWKFADANIEPNKTLVQSGPFTAPSGNYSVTAPVLRASIHSRRLAVDLIGTPVFSNAITSVTHRLVFDGPVASNALILVEYRSLLSGGEAWKTNEVVPSETTNRISTTFINNANSTNDWKNRMFFRIRNT